MGLERYALESTSDGRAIMAVECLVPGWKTIFKAVEGGTQLLLMFEEDPE